jgi:L-asparaginase / beta-aspartyl-peptidase
MNYARIFLFGMFFYTVHAPGHKYYIWEKVLIFFQLMGRYAIAVHGGAGTILRRNMTPEAEEGYRAALQEALDAGTAILENGGQALDAVEAATMRIEDNPLFNAGRGAVFTHEGKIEMDAAIMDGATRLAGAVAGVKHVRNPVRLARAVMEKSEHVFLVGKGAEEFARFLNIEMEPEEYFYTEYRYQQLMAIREANKTMLDHIDQVHDDKKFGTGGAVACDHYGNIAAATSTGGMTNKRYGRVGDSPLVGAGTYANNKTCAVSCTGHGEYFIRAVVAYDISCLMEYKGLSLFEASRIVVNDKLVADSGEGGLIAVDAMGNIALPFNTEGMYRGMKIEGEPAHIAIYKDEVIA